MLMMLISQAILTIAVFMVFRQILLLLKYHATLMVTKSVSPTLGFTLNMVATSVWIVAAIAVFPHFLLF